MSYSANFFNVGHTTTWKELPKWGPDSFKALTDYLKEERSFTTGKFTGYQLLYDTTQPNGGKPDYHLDPHAFALKAIQKASASENKKRGGKGQIIKAPLVGKGQNWHFWISKDLAGVGKKSNTLAGAGRAVLFVEDWPSDQKATGIGGIIRAILISDHYYGSKTSFMQEDGCPYINQGIGLWQGIDFNPVQAKTPTTASTAATSSTSSSSSASSATTTASSTISAKSSAKSSASS